MPQELFSGKHMRTKIPDFYAGHHIFVWLFVPHKQLSTWYPCTVILPQYVTQLGAWENSGNAEQENGHEVGQHNSKATVF